MDEATFKDWRRQDDTKEVFRYLEHKLNEMKDAWATGRFTTDSADGTIQLNAEALGKADCLNEIIHLEAEDVSIT